MKFTLKLAAVFMLCFLCSLNMQAQRGGRGGDPIEMAQKQTQRMTDSLTLSTAQANKVSEINLKYANKVSDFRKAARESEDFDRTTMRENMQKMRGEQTAELQTILTKDQWTKFEKMEEARMQKREGRKGRKGKGGKKS
ncbi:MAG: protein CpxP [Polaribacter sp.]|jgi:protein CpxP